MKFILLLILILVVLQQLLKRESSALVISVSLVILALVSRMMMAPLISMLCFIAAIGVVVCGYPQIRQQWLTPRLFKFFKQVSPKISETEQVALDAGTVGWDGELFSGKPNWKKLLSNPDQGLSAEEQSFVDQQCSVAVGMCDNWDIAMERADLPGDLWQFLKKEKFFGMIIPREYGGLEFSAKAQSAVLQKLAASETLMIVVGVPNSLGPGELLLKYGTDEQKQHYLPRLADGRDIPCFGLTGPRAGSDATSIPDVGIVCKGQHEGEEVLGVRLNFEKRWITLAPIATVVGLAFRMFDPEHLLGDQEDIGITCALIPRETEGMEIGRRHYPIGAPFMNGPIKGKDVFIPLSWLIGGPAMAGQGWKMLVECLSVGRCITLPSGASGSGRYLVGMAGGFTRIRRQFNLPVADMEGVQQPLARIAALAYISRATVRHTANMIDAGEKPAVPSAILKSNLTEFQRQMAMDAMDVHGGKTVTLGPRNYLGLDYAATAVSITVEGANIMTRSLMIFGQGAIRCHPWVLPELRALEQQDESAFDRAIFSHISMVTANAARAFGGAMGLPGETVPFSRNATLYVKAVNRFSAAFSFMSDVAMASLGASLKQRELLSARLGDMLSSLYMLSMLLKQWQESSPVQQEADLLDYSCQYLLHRNEQALVELLDNLPNRWVAGVARCMVMPFGRSCKMPSDALVSSIAQAVSTDSPLRQYLLEDTWQIRETGQENCPMESYNKLLAENARAADIYRTVDKAYARGELPATALHPEQRFVAAAKAGLIDETALSFMQDYEARVLDMLTVDDFAFDELARNKSKVIWHNGKPKASASAKG